MSNIEGLGPAAAADPAPPVRQRRDSAGKVIPAWFIQEVTASHNGKPVMAAQWGPSVAKNPFLQFTLKGAKAGDKVAVSWKDNKGDSRTDEATVS